MDSESLIGIIDLDSENVKCVIFKNYSDGTSEVLSSSLIKSQGIKNSKIVNLSKASDAIRRCINEAEKKGKVSLKKINVVLEQPDFLCTKLSKSRKIGGAKIQNEDIEFLLKEAKKQIILNDCTQSIIHIFNHNYVVDGKKFSEEPINIYADFLSHELTFVTLPLNNLKNINQAFLDCDLEVDRLISSTFSLGSKLLNNNQLETGSILIEFGFEKVSIGIFKKLALINSSTFSVGANHITKDISKVCSLSLEESEVIRNSINFSLVDNSQVFDKNDYLKEIFFNTSSYRKVSKILILKIIESRLNEILETIQKKLTEMGVDLNSKNDICIAGKYSNLLNIEKYWSSFFKMDVKKLDHESREKKSLLFDSFGACVGAFKIINDGWETEAIAYSDVSHNKKTGFFARLFGNYL